MVFLPTLTPKSKSSCPGTVANYYFAYRAKYPQSMLLPLVPTGGQGCAGFPKVRQKKGAWSSCSSTTAGSASPHQSYEPFSCLSKAAFPTHRLLLSESFQGPHGLHGAQFRG